MRSTSLRLCEADSLTSGGLTRVLASTHDPYAHNNNQANDKRITNNGSTEIESEGGGAIMLAGQGGFRLWDLETNMARCFILFTIRYVESEYASSSRSSVVDNAMVSPSPKPVSAPVTHIRMVSSSPESPASHVIFTLWQHASVFVSQIPRLLDPQDDVDGSDWLMKGGEVYQLPSHNTLRQSQSNTQGQNTCIETYNTHHTTSHDRSTLVASGTENGFMTVWSLPTLLVPALTGDSKCDDVMREDETQTDSKCLGHVQAFTGSPITSICFVSLSTAIVAGTEPSIHVYIIPSNQKNQHATELIRATTIRTGLPSVRCMASLSISTDRHFVGCGFDNGAMFVWEIKTSVSNNKYGHDQQQKKQIGDDVEDRKEVSAKLDGALLDYSEAAISCASFAVSEDGLALVVVGTQDCNLCLFQRNETLQRTQSGDTQSEWMLLAQTQLQSVPIAAVFANGNVVATCATGLQHWDPNGSLLGNNNNPHQQHINYISTSRTDTQTRDGWTEPNIQVRVEHHSLNSTGRNKTVRSDCNSSDQVERQLWATPPPRNQEQPVDRSRYHGFGEGDRRHPVNEETLDDDHEMPTPAPAQWIPRPQPHPLRANITTPDNTITETRLGDNGQPTLAAATMTLPSRDQIVGHDRNDRQTQQSIWQHAELSDGGSTPIPRDTRPQIGNGRNSSGSSRYAVNLKERDQTFGRAFDNAPLCFDGLRGQDVPPLPLSELQEPGANTTLVIHAKLQEARNSKYPGKQKKLNEDDENGGEEERSTNYKHQQRSALRLDASQFEDTNYIDNMDLASVNTGSPTHCVARRVPPQVSVGWRHVPLRDRLPELSRRHAVRCGRQRRDSSDGGEGSSQEGEDPVSNIRTARPPWKDPNSRVNDDVGSRERSNRAVGTVRLNERDEQGGVGPRVVGDVESQGSVASSGNSSGSSGSSSVVPWFYRQQTRNNDIWAKDEFFLTRADDGRIQFHNFRSLQES